jgi:hypothetical protein
MTVRTDQGRPGEESFRADLRCRLRRVSTAVSFTGGLSRRS